MNPEAVDRTNIFSRITDTIFAVLIGLSFVQFYWLIAPPQISLRLAMLSLAYVLIILSRIGFHLSIQKKPYCDNKRFLIDLGILYSYFVLLVSPGFDQNSTPDILLMLGSLVSIFFGYFLWDLFKNREYKEKLSKGILINIICLIISGAIFATYYFIQFEIPLTIVPIDNALNYIFIIASYVNIIIFWYPKMKNLFKKT